VAVTVTSNVTMSVTSYGKPYATHVLACSVRPLNTDPRSVIEIFCPIILVFCGHLGNMLLFLNVITLLC
jgi:hypothetical protein